MGAGKSGKRVAPAKGQKMRHPLRSTHAVLESRSQPPRDRPRPLIWRMVVDVDSDMGSGADPQHRSPSLALIEAALMLAEEPVPGRKLAQVAGLKDGREARALVLP